jgi:fructose-1,6-bisphosphatase I / sedoheptulose-1,7-bisphosphatase
MTLSRGWTLKRYLAEACRCVPADGGQLAALVLDVALACKAISRLVSFGEIGEAGDRPAQPLDVSSNEVFLRTNAGSGTLAGIASVLLPQPRQMPAGQPRGSFLLAFDPLEGGGNADVNVAVGSIFSVLRAPQIVVDSGRDVSAADFLQPGSAQVAAGYALYGPVTMLVLSVGDGVAGFTLNPERGEFELTHPNLRVPQDTPAFAINTGDSRAWEPPVKRYVDECLAGEPGPRGKDFSMRWIASLVAEAHRILLRGGVFVDPRDTRAADRPGRLHLLCGANPIGYIIEQAGGRASTGRQPILAVKPGALQQRVGLVFGAKNEVERIERYHQEPAVTDSVSPLFAERSLFRS